MISLFHIRFFKFGDKVYKNNMKLERSQELASLYHFIIYLRKEEDGEKVRLPTLNQFGSSSWMAGCYRLRWLRTVNARHQSG